MIRYLYNGVDVTNSGFTDANDISYPNNWARLASEIERQRLGIITEEVVEVINLEEIKNNTWELIKQERDRRVQNGGYKVGSKWYHSDTFSRTQQMALVMLGASLPPSLAWKTMDGSFIQMTPSLAQQIFGAGAMQDTLTFAKAEYHKTQVNSLVNKAQIDAYDIYADWPIIYGE